ncbi:NERD domain-containing protein [Bacteroides sp. AF20-13LB]|nr:NERD domain-containing protein [Bacteroides sp. AF20-13LB]
MPFASIIFTLCLITGIVYLVYLKRKERELIEQVTPITRGEWSERRVVLRLLKMGINPKAIFHDLYIQKPNGEYTQVDVAVATKVGIIVFEVKDYSGWIFGNEHQKYWTQLLAYGKEKHRFYNPVMQNSGHIQAIRQCLQQNPDTPIYSVIVFFGSSEFKDVTCNANNTFIIYPRSIQQVVSEILMQPNANFGNKYEIMNLFTKAVQNGNNPMIVSSQINSAAYYGRNTPQSTYTISFGNLFRFGGFSYRRRF